MGGETDAQGFTEGVVSAGNGSTSQVLWPGDRGEITRTRRLTKETMTSSSILHVSAGFCLPCSVFWMLFLTNML